MNRERIRCPACGATMNRHAEKVEDSGERPADDLGGVIMEIHTSPQCDLVVERPVEG